MGLDIMGKDYIVVRSAPGGATVAKELSQRNKKVIIAKHWVKYPVRLRRGISLFR